MNASKVLSYDAKLNILKMRGLTVVLLLVASFALGETPAPKASPSPSEPSAADYEMRWGVKIPLRDKVELNATLYLPKNSDGSLARNPVIFTLTPYIADSYHPRATYFASHGYAFALIDIRGRGNSGGEPDVSEDRDGYDVVEWLAQQPFCDGKVAMWGGSYAGFNQWGTAKEFPPHLATIVPAAAAHRGIDFPFPNNVGVSYDVQWLTFTSGHTVQRELFADSKFWRAKFLEAYKKHVPFKSLDSFVGNPSTQFQRWVAHPAYDSYWQAFAPTREQYQKITLPALSITGQYDGDELGALTYYRNHIANASPEARAKHFLIIGPWDHAGTRTPTDDVGGVKFGPAAVLDLNDLHRQWYDWTMKSKQKPEFLKDQVAYYVIAAGNSGANGEWKYAPSLEALTAGARPLFLDSANGDANGVFRSGMLSEKKPAQGVDTFTYDPLDTSRGENVESMEPDKKIAGLDQRYALNISVDGLVYHSEPLPNETPLIGTPKATLWVSIDTPDTDLIARLYEIQPDGTSIPLWEDVRRLRYRESITQEKLVKPGEIVRCDFAPGLFVARKLATGSRLRLVISAPNSIFFQKNYNSGGVVAEETAKDARTAHIKVHHDAEHASAIELPLR
jgi:putative CocE/NonD family hydrolase